ncbi:Na+/H+ antiporter subunit D [Chengkuizengella axinellae]|uniref:Na+/H+ antiporter subunit D n=1 Tax=Chengkuizengella axinellae TaxID=3064388 RepID=A0ABT9ITT3_9BACL|nr:Na+/H+ antiporter subunit D [Chengkuizengella sp. 2205SS18-9]MDP5272753.1 Na+/H+ antiporter subunit D [Chengkuizengella sp. 2205SS18-9]
MSNFIILPILIPILTGILLVFFRTKITLQKWLSVIALILNTLNAGYLIYIVNQKGIQTLEIGGWKPPFGIVFVADMFALLLVFTTNIIAIFCLWYAFKTIGKGRESYFFYPFFQFLIAGVSGSFLTGDIFNLFVFFEVMLISSYVLIVLGGRKIQLRESIKYVLVNIVSSILFVSSVAFLYGITGTLNIADLSVKVTQLGLNGPLLVVAFLFLIVFSLKAALFVYFWLPGSYSAPPAAIAAIFSALLTKVGIYAIIRTFSIIFYQEPQITHQFIAWIAALTMILGVIGAVAYNNVKQILAYNVITSVGFIVFGFAVFSKDALEGVIFYLIHDMNIKALLFLAGGALITIAGSSQLKDMGGFIKKHALLGWILFITALALAGIPPLSGFIGKLLILKGALAANSITFYWFTGIALLSSLLVLYSVTKIFMNAFWKEPNTNVESNGNIKGILAPCIVLLLFSVILGVGAEWLYPFVEKAAAPLMDPSIYIDAVLKE